MVDRLLIAFVIVACGVGGWILFNRVSLWRMKAKSVSDPLLANLRSSTPTIVYFTTPFCAPCKTLQSPALAQLKGELDEGIQILQIDAAEQPDVADRWGVFSAPTTFVLDHNRVLLHINRGVASAETLKKQLAV
jgi:thiol-disulfide isomerase/thioredoxin